MIRLGSSWYNCIYWSNFETLLADYESSSMKHMIIIRLACTKANSYSNFFTRPKKGSANTLVLTHGSGAISEARVILCA